MFVSEHYISDSVRMGRVIRSHSTSCNLKLTICYDTMHVYVYIIQPCTHQMEIEAGHKLMGYRAVWLKLRSDYGLKVKRLIIKVDCVLVIQTHFLIHCPIRD